MAIRRRARRGKGQRGARPLVERMEGRRLLSAADGGGPLVTGVSQRLGRRSASIVVTFDGALDSTRAGDLSRYRLEKIDPADAEFVTPGGRPVRIRSAKYDDGTHQVTLALARPTSAGATYRLEIDGSPGSGLTAADGTLFDGDDDDTPGGDFDALLAQGRKLDFADLDGDHATVRLRRGGSLQLWRELDGDVDVLTVSGGRRRPTLTGAVRPTPGSDGVVVLPTIEGLAGVNNQLPASFVSEPPPPAPSPAPIVATPANLPYTLRIEPVAMPEVPAIQAAVYGQAGGKWLLFGGRTNGLHNFDPSGVSNFPPLFQNPEIIVIDPATGQTWTRPWSETGLPASVTASLASSNQEFYQEGDRLYTVGGYSFDRTTGQFTTYDTLSAVSVGGLIDAVIHHGDVAAQVRQIRDPRLQVTGGEMHPLDGRAYLVFGQRFDGGYSFPPTATQVYSDEVRSFRIVDDGTTLAINDYRVQRDPVNFRRRDYTLGPVVFPDGQAGLTAYGGVFTPQGGAHRMPIVLGPDGRAKVDTGYRQYFHQYNAARVPLFDARDGSMITIFFGGISLYHYDFTTGTLTSDPQLPFVNDVTSFVRRADGSAREYMMPTQLPGLLGTEAAFFASPALPAYPNGVVKLDQLQGPTTLGYIYGGIFSKLPNTTDQRTQTTASNLVFRVTLVPR